MSELEHDKEAGQEQGAHEAEASASFHWRRRILLAGVTTPVVATLYSRAAFGQDMISPNMSCSESARAMGSQDECYGSGFPPSFWASNASLFHHNYPAGSSFDHIFGVNEVFGGASLAQVCSGAAPNGVFVGRVLEADLRLQRESEAEVEAKVQEVQARCSHLGSHAVAALQNAATAVPYDYTTERVFSYVSAAFNQAANYGETMMMESVASDLEALNNQGNGGRVDWVAVLEQRRYGA